MQVKSIIEILGDIVHLKGMPLPLPTVPGIVIISDDRSKNAIQAFLKAALGKAASKTYTIKEKRKELLRSCGPASCKVNVTPKDQ